MGPRVSVLLPVRDEEPYLAECLESLSAQTLSDFEVIAVDDGSSDETPGILEAHARADSRLRVLRQEPAGMVAASERARVAARAPLLARMDADDVALPERLELQVAAIEEDGLAAVGGRVEYFPDPTDRMSAYADWLNSLVTVDAAIRDLWVKCPLPGPGLRAGPNSFPTATGLARELLAAGTPLAAFVEVDPRKLGKRIHGAPVVPVERAGDFPGALYLGAVSGPEGRARVRELAAELGLVEGRDFVAVA